MLQSPRGDASSIEMAAARREQRKRRIAGESVDVLQMKNENKSRQPSCARKCRANRGLNGKRDRFEGRSEGAERMRNEGTFYRTTNMDKFVKNGTTRD